MNWASQASNIQQQRQLITKKRKIQTCNNDENNQWQFIFQPLIDCKINAEQLQEFFQESKGRATDGQIQRKIYKQLKLIPEQLLPTTQTWFEFFAPVYHSQRDNGKQQSFFDSWSIPAIQHITKEQRFITLPFYLRMFNTNDNCESNLHCNSLILDMQERVLLRWDSNGAHGTGPTQGQCYIPVIQHFHNCILR